MMPSKRISTLVTSPPKTCIPIHMAATKKSTSATNHCWPGYEPVPGKAHNEKGSCQPKPGKQSKSVRRTDQKAAAASKLQKTNPR